MSNYKFSKPPLLPSEKEKKMNEDEFVNGSAYKATEKHKKEKSVPIYMMITESLYKDIQELMSLTGLSMKATCVGLIQGEVKKKIKELKS